MDAQERFEEAARRYLPDQLRLLFIAEALPAFKVNRQPSGAGRPKALPGQAGSCIKQLRLPSLKSGSRKKDNARRTTHRRIVAGERQTSRAAINARRRNVIAALIACIHKSSPRIDLYVPRIIARR